MYEPVATFIKGKTESFIEGELLKVTQEMGLDVDRAELLKALKYDRGQYEKGYQDGWRNALNMGRIPQYMPDDTVYDCYGIAWTVMTAEIHKSKDGKLQILYRCGHPGTNDYRALYDHEIIPESQMDGGNEE